MNNRYYFGLLLLKFLAVVVSAAVGLIMGALIGDRICMWFVYPDWVKQYPHDGQLSLGAFLYDIYGAIIGAGLFVIAAIAVLWRKKFKNCMRSFWHQEN